MTIFSGSEPKALLRGGAKRFASRKAATAEPLVSATAESLESSGITKPRKAAFSRKKLAFAEQSGFKKASLAHDENK